MAFFDEQARIIHTKVVFAGPGGVRACTRYIHGRVDPSLVGQVLRERFGDDELEAFDFLPATRLPTSGYRTRLHLYAADGPSPAAHAREVLLRGVDALVFVADGAPERAGANAPSFAALGESYAALGGELAKVPLVVAIDHASSDVIDAAGLLATLGLPADLVPLWISSASGANVLDTIKQATRLVLEALRGPAAGST